MGYASSGSGAASPDWLLRAPSDSALRRGGLAVADAALQVKKEITHRRDDDQQAAAARPRGQAQAVGRRDDGRRCREGRLAKAGWRTCVGHGL